MKLISLVCILIGVSFYMATAGGDGGERAKIEYRKRQAEMILNADRVIVYLVDFDSVSAEKRLEGENVITVPPYKSTAAILATKSIEGDHLIKFRNALAKQIAKPVHEGGAFCHFPIHGIRVYRGDRLLHEGTFCWICRNFSFTYPKDADWLDASKELEQLFAEVMPVPQKELDRFQEKYPRSKQKEEVQQ